MRHRTLGKKKSETKKNLFFGKLKCLDGVPFAHRSLFQMDYNTDPDAWLWMDWVGDRDEDWCEEIWLPLYGPVDRDGVPLGYLLVE